MKNIHIGGVFYGCHNIGDEAILYSILELFSNSYNLSVSTYGSNWIKSAFPNCEIEPILQQYAKPKFGIRSVPRKTLIKNVINTIKEMPVYQRCDGYLCGGATILSDCPWYSLRTVEFAGRYHKNVVLWGVGLADGVDSETSDYIRSILNKEYVWKVYTRDELVAKRLIKMGVKKEKIGISYDPAIRLDGEDFNLNDYLSDSQISILNNGRENICVSISGEQDVIAKTDINEISKFIRSLSSKYNIFLIPTGCGSQCKDRELLNKLYKMLNNPNVTFISKEFEPRHLIEFLKRFKFSISSRLHLNIFSCDAGIPSIGLVRNSKITDFSLLYKLPYVELRGLNTENVMSAVNLIENNYQTIKSSIAITRNKMIDAQMLAYEEVIKNWEV